MHLLEQARTRGWRRFLYTSTGSVHQTWSDIDKPIPENARPEPQSLYGVTKRCGEMMVDTYSRNYNLSAASVRLSWVYGPPLVPESFEGPRGPIPHFLKNIIAGECSTPAVISIISCCNDPLVKRKLEINEKSNILIIGCEGDTDKNLYNKLYKIGNQKLKKYD